jgi:hypothetical protein
MKKIRAVSYIKMTIIISLALFILSFAFPALTYLDYDGKKTAWSFQLFITGAFVILGGGLPEWLTWLANPLYLISIVLLFKRKRSSIKTSIAAALIAFSFFFWKDILISESGSTAIISSFKPGYYLWLGSMILLSARTVIYFKRIDKMPPIPHN